MNKAHQFARYKAYKDSGVEWLGEVPEDWYLSRIHDCAIPQKNRNIGLKNKNLLSLSYGKIISKDINTSFGLLPASFETYQIVTDGNIILRLTDLQNDKKSLRIGLVTQLGIITSAYLCLKFNNRIDPVFSYYLLYTYDISKVFYWYGGGLRSTMKYDDIKVLPFLTPSLPEQAVIAIYLSTKTAQIDQKIDLLTQKAIQYGKLKQSLINETVIHGLDKTVAMKDSSGKWIGEVPIHWEVQRIGTAFEERSEKVSDKDYPPLSVSMRGIVPQMKHVAKTDNNGNRKRVAVGDYVINSRSDRRGASGISIYDGSVAVISIVLVPRRSFFGKYLHHLFRSYRFIEEFYRVGRGIVDDLWTTRYSIMKTIEFASPSYEEQRMIADYLDEKTAQIDIIVETIGIQIERLKELRETLINDVVTGKIKVVE